LREIVAQIRFVDHFLNIAQLIGPTAEIRSSNGPFGHPLRAAAPIIVRPATIEEALAAIIIAGLVALALTPAFTLLIPWLLIVRSLLAILTLFALLVALLLAALTILLSLLLTLTLLIRILRRLLLASSIFFAGLAILLALLLTAAVLRVEIALFTAAALPQALRQLT
jgi:hypothetical protein